LANPILEQALASLIGTFSAVTALCGSRIYPDEVPQAAAKTYPQMEIEIEEENYQDSETLDFLGGLVMATVRIRTISNLKSQARALAEALRTNGTDPGTGLAGYDGTVNSMLIKAKLDHKQSGYIPEEDGSDSGRYAVDSTYSITFQESK